MIWPVGQPAGELYGRAIRTRKIWEELNRAAGIWSDPVGSLHMAYAEDEWTVLQEIYEMFRSEGRPVEIIHGADLHTKIFHRHPAGSQRRVVQSG